MSGGDGLHERVNVLMVDDQPEGLLALEAVLGGLGQNLVRARSGREALRQLLDRDFALILLDVHMPDMDGYETAEAIRQRERTRHTPIIFLTASHRSEIHVFEGYSRGAVDYIFKPLEPEVLRSKVKVFIELAQREQDVRRLAALLAEQAADLAATNDELESFVHSVSHDLRAPLRAIQGFGRSLQETCGDRLGKEGADYLRRMCAAGERMSALIEDLLALSRVTRTPVVRSAVDVSGLSHAVAGELQATDPARRVTWTIAPGLEAQADAGLVRIVLENLLGNAWKYTRWRPEATIEVGRLPGGAFFVKDDGVGFDMRYANKLFVPFQRLHSASEFEGTGVGLATVHRIVKRHGGRVWAEAAPGDGATIHFTLEGGA